MESKPVTQSSGYWDFSSKPTTILDQVHVHGFESSSSSSSHMIIDNNNNHQELYHLQNGMELLGFPSSKNLQQTHSNNARDSIITPPKSSYYSLNPPLLHPTDFWKARSESDHQGSYHPHFDHNPIQKHDFSGGYSDIATHSGSNELSRESETPRFPIEIPLQIETSQSNLTQSLIVTPETAWQQNRLMASWSNRFPGEEKEDDSSLRCVFPCEGNERPSQGLSLSLSPHKPCNIGLQSFELREAHSRDGFCGRSSNQFIQDGRSFITTSSSSSFSFQHHQLKNSKYLAPAQELLNEFCNLGTKQTSNTRIEHKLPKIGKWEKSSNYRNSEGNNQSLYSTDLLQLQERKIKLLSMLEEVDRRYKQYCEQMRAVVSSFESVAGNGAANMYSALASKAMSKHFRCLRDGIVGQIQATKKAMGEKDPVAPGTTRGETPRLKLLDQTLRQQRAFQQMGILESHPWRPQRGLPERSVSVLRAWLFEHFLHPYPSDVDKHILARQTGLSRSQVSNWFINARVRLWKPMVEEMYTEETKAHDKALEDEAEIENSLLNDQNPNPNPNSPSTPPQHPSMDDQKPTPPQPLLHDSESLASIINSETRNPKNHHQQHFIRADHFSTVPDLDFSSYNHAASTVTYSNDDSSSQRGNFRNGGGVSLTLGLQHSGSGGGVNLSLFSPAAHHSLFFSRGEHMGDDDDECGPVEYGVLEGEETEGNSGFGSQGLPYRNLVGAQLLHDFAG